MMNFARLPDLIDEARKTLRLWRRRSATRHALHHLSPHLRADIGYDSIACAKEARRWFWQAPDTAAKTDGKARMPTALDRPVTARTAAPGSHL